jgi:hypothetical protein
MKRGFTTARVAALMALLPVAALQAQAADSATQQTAPAADSATHKKHGLLHTAEKAAGNKVVQTVAKTAACTMLPGGQVVAGAIDAAANPNAGGAATGAAEAATGAGCSNAMGNLTGAPNQAGQQAMTNAMTQGQTPPMDPRMQAQMGMINAMGIKTDEEAQAKCVGLSVEEYRIIMAPPSMGMTKEQMKQQQAIGKKLDPKKQRECGMQAGNQMMAMVQMMTANAQAKMNQASSNTMTEAPGQTIDVPADLAAQLKAGKVVIRNIDWVAGSSSVSAAGQPGFQDAMAKVGAALKDAGGKFRLDIYMDQRYDDDGVNKFGPERLTMVQLALAPSGLDPSSLKVGKAQKDKEPRLEIVRQ